MNLSEMFVTLKEHRIKYVVLENWISLPSDAGSVVHLLAENPKMIISLLGGSRVSGSRYLIHNTAFVIRQKGENFLPERFESELLERAVMHQEIVRVPDDRNAPWLFLYRRLYHDGNIVNPTEKKVLERVLDERVGRPVVPRDRDVSLHYTRH